MKKVINTKSRFYNGIPVRDARADMFVQPLSEDIQQAVQGDPENCAYARCIKRTMHSQTVFIYKNVAYIQTLDEDGNPLIQRWIISQRARRYIKAFDQGETIREGGFWFQAPRGSKTLSYHRNWTATDRANNADRYKQYQLTHQKNKLLGTVKSKTPSEFIMGSFRDGVGQVKFVGEGRKLQKHRLRK
jgi:hypothetical protein